MKTMNIIGNCIGNKRMIKGGSPPITKEWWEEYGVRGEYIKSDGTAYIDTDYVLQYDNGITEIMCSSDEVSRTNGIYGFVERSGNLANRISIGISGGWFVGSGATHRLGDAIDNSKVNIIWDRNKEIVWFNGEEIEALNTLKEGNEYTAYLCSRNDKGEQDADGIYNLTGNVYYLKEILNDVVQFSLIPIQVTKSFVDLKGVTHSVGDWIMVNELVDNDVPTHYGTFSGGGITQELEWFETTPNSTSIKTNFIPTNVTAPLTKIELMCSLTSGSVGYLVNGIGGGPTMYIGMNPAGNIAYGNLASDANVSYKLNYDTYYKITIDYKNKTISINDTVIANDIRLYSYNRNDATFGLNCYVNPANNTIFNTWGQKTQYCKIYIDDVLTHHWVGQLNDDIVDIYDKIKQVYLSDSGLIVGKENIIPGTLKTNE